MNKREIDGWIPSCKWQLVDWMVRHFNEPAKKFNKMRKDMLYAIYFKERRANESGSRV